MIKDQPPMPPMRPITVIQKGLEEHHSQLRALFIKEGSGALRENYHVTRFAILLAKELADARGEEFARHLPVPHLPAADQSRSLEVCFRRNKGLRIAYQPTAIVEYFSDGFPFLVEDMAVMVSAGLRFKNVVALEQTRARDVTAEEMLNPVPDSFLRPGLRLGEHYGGFCWEIENSKLVPIVLAEQAPPDHRRLVGQLRHWLIRLGLYKFEIVGTSIQFPTKPVRHVKLGQVPPA